MNRKTGKMEKMVDWEKRKAEREDLKDTLEYRYGVRNHEKADLLFELAWEYGHACGEHEVKSYYSELVRLIR